MKLFTIVALSFLAATLSSHAGLFQFGSARVETEWNKLAPDQRKQVQTNLIRAGLNSAGRITVSGIYTLTFQEKIGMPGQKVALLIQDLPEGYEGDRLFAIYLVNLDTAKVFPTYQSRRIE